MLTIKNFDERFSNRIPGFQAANGHFAVLVPVIEKDGEPHLLLEVRSERVGRQPGEVCFPGGRFEPGETPVECALRETNEELGIPSKAIRVIAELDLMVHLNNNILHPVLAQIDSNALDHLMINEAEVKEIFLVPFSILEQNPYRYNYLIKQQVGPDFPYERIGFKNGYPWQGRKAEILIYEYEGHPIWGLTAQIIRWLIRTLRGDVSTGGPDVSTKVTMTVRCE